MPTFKDAYIPAGHRHNVQPEEVVHACHRDRSPTLRAGAASQLYFADGSFRVLPPIAVAASAAQKEQAQKSGAKNFIESSPAKFTTIQPSATSNRTLSVDALVQDAYTVKLPDVGPSGSRNGTTEVFSQAPFLATAQRSARWLERTGEPSSDGWPPAQFVPDERTTPTYGRPGWRAPRPGVEPSMLASQK